MKSSTHYKLFSLQHHIYRSLEKEADRLLGPQPPEIKKYERTYAANFNHSHKRLRSASKSDLIAAIRKADVSFVADFHTFKQAQRTALRLIRDAILPGEKWWIGLELIPSHYQDLLDAFQAGMVPLEAFHEQIRYNDEWGFPWRNYSPLFEWASTNKVRLIALNRPKELFSESASLRRAKTNRELTGRDQWSAGVITDLFASAGAPTKRQETRPRMIVLYGELHLASQHLPLQLDRISRNYTGRALKTLLVHQNVDSIYWSLAKKRKEHQTNVLKLSKKVFCVISSTPWAKLQSLVSWAEGDLRQTPEQEDEVQPIDYLSEIKHYGQTIAEVLNITPPHFDWLNLRTILEANFVERLDDKDLFSKTELRLIRHHIASNQRMYIPGLSIAYIGTPSQNRAAELAALYLFYSRTRSERIFDSDPDHFFRLVIEAGFGFFGSLIINPRRKCDFFEDHLRRLKHLIKSDKPLDQIEANARALSLKVLKAEKTHIRGKTFRLPALSKFMRQSRLAPSAMLSARFLGQILGKKLHQSLIMESIQIEDIRRLCLSRATGSHRQFSLRYLELIALTRSARLGPSKMDTL